jgi:hypothetical protein
LVIKGQSKTFNVVIFSKNEKISLTKAGVRDKMSTIILKLGCRGE